MNLFVGVVISRVERIIGYFMNCSLFKLMLEQFCGLLQRDADVKFNIGSYVVASGYTNIIVSNNAERDILMSGTVSGMENGAFSYINRYIIHTPYNTVKYTAKHNTNRTISRYFEQHDAAWLARYLCYVENHILQIESLTYKGVKIPLKKIQTYIKKTSATALGKAEALIAVILTRVNKKLTRCKVKIAAKGTKSADDSSHATENRRNMCDTTTIHKPKKVVEKAGKVAGLVAFLETMEA